LSRPSRSAISWPSVICVAKSASFFCASCIPASGLSNTIRCFA
jgi:hypothetical protein